MYRRSSIPSIWREMHRFQDEMNRLFDASYSRTNSLTDSIPPMNIYASAEAAVIQAEVPGVELKDLELSVIGNTLTISGNRASGQPDGETTWHRQERAEGYFSRSIELPFAVEAEKVEATLTNGILKINLPRAEADKPRRITVRNP